VESGRDVAASLTGLVGMCGLAVAFPREFVAWVPQACARVMMCIVPRHDAVFGGKKRSLAEPALPVQGCERCPGAGITGLIDLLSSHL
jgi:hypothetical protein